MFNMLFSKDKLWRKKKNRSPYQYAPYLQPWLGIKQSGNSELEEHEFKAQPSLPVAKKKPGGSRKQNYDHLDVCFTKSNRGNNLLTIDGKPFTLNRRIRDVCYWECVKLRCKYTKCSARVVTKSNQISALRGFHNHP